MKYRPNGGSWPVVQCPYCQQLVYSVDHKLYDVQGRVHHAGCLQARERGEVAAVVRNSIWKATGKDR